MNSLKIIVIGFSILVGVSLFFFNMDADEMKGVKGFSSYLMLFFTVAGIESILNLVSQKMGFNYGYRK